MGDKENETSSLIISSFEAEEFKEPKVDSPRKLREPVAVVSEDKPVRTCREKV